MEFPKGGKQKMKKIIIISVLLFIPEPAYASGVTELMTSTFGVGGKAAVISTIIAIAIGTWVLESIASIIGKANYSNWIKLTGMFIALSLFVTTAIGVINKILSYIFP
jgi:hypothetical protein